MWILLGLAGAAGYYLLTRETAEKLPGVFAPGAPGVEPGAPLPDGVVLSGGVQHFTEGAAQAIADMLPAVDLAQVGESQGAKTFRIVPSVVGGTTAAEAVGHAVASGLLVAASTSLLSTVVEDHFIVIAFRTPDMPFQVAAPGSPNAILWEGAVT